jgi:hypothetical protein
LFAGGSFNTSFTKFFPGQRACDVEDLLSKPVKSLPFSVKFGITVEGDPYSDTGTIGLGGFGVLITPQKTCHFEENLPLTPF